MTPSPAPAGPRAWLGLAVLALPTLLVSIDVSVMLLALPHISAGLGANSTQTLWIMDIYGFMLAGSMLTMGTLGDRVGRRTLLMLGATAFGLASILAACSTSATMLIGARALLGVAGATLAPSILALIGNLFRDPRQRALAISLWLVCFMGGMAAGPLVGGAVLERFWWGAVFLLAVPVMALLLATAPLLLPEYRDPRPGRLDLPSVGLCLATILPLIYGLKEVARRGPEPLPVLAMVVGAAVGVAFVRRQRRLESPLLDVRLFGNRAFSAAVGGLFGLTLTGATMLFITQYLQFVAGLSPLHAGLWMVPAVGASIAGFLVSPLLARRVRPAHLIGAGLVVSAAGAVLLTRVEATSPLPLLVACYALLNLGAAPLVSLATDLVVGSVPPEKAGSAAALSETSGELAFAFGIASLGSLGAAVYRGRLDAAGLPAQLAEAARDSLAGAVTAAATLPEPAAAALLASAHDAFVDGLHAVAATSALVLLGVAVLALTMLRHVRPLGAAPEHAGDAGASPLARPAAAERRPSRPRADRGPARAGAAHRAAAGPSPAA
jgi:MFS transporter, DHA2 family, multidrug resistance protein